MHSLVYAMARCMSELRSRCIVETAKWIELVIMHCDSIGGIRVLSSGTVQ